MDETNVVLLHFMLLQQFEDDFFTILVIVLTLLLNNERLSKKRRISHRSFSMIQKMPQQEIHLNRIVGDNDTDTIVNLRMDRNTFGRLCKLCRGLGTLTDGKYVFVEEQIAIFLSILAHRKKNKIMGFDFIRSGQTVSYYLKLHTQLLVKPEPVSKDSTDGRWKWFKGCLGALDGTYIPLSVPLGDQPRYRLRKGEICTNTLAVCDRDLNFIYLFPGWEGSAVDSRVLRDSIPRHNGLKVPIGNYYLCDAGYANSEGFLAPYRSIRYHLKEWGPDRERPQNARELFNMRHSKARNVIERAFGVIKKRWGILRSPSFYPVKVQNRLIMACFILHNFIRKEMHEDPVEAEAADDLLELEDQDAAVVEPVFIDTIENTTAWSTFRDNMSQEMWAAYLLEQP